jgi:DNA-binding response OmpR family regulator
MGARILVIDDDPEVRATLGQTLTAAGHQILLAEDGGKGLQLHRATPANLVITDLVMPGTEGLETIRAFRNEFPKVPIIAISGRPDMGNILEVARRLGAVRTLEKPFQPDELLALVGAVLQATLSEPAAGNADQS